MILDLLESAKFDARKDRKLGRKGKQRKAVKLWRKRNKAAKKSRKRNR